MHLKGKIMISNISFTGKVYYLGNTKYYNKNHLDEINTIQHYADDNNLDIVVLSKYEYINNSGFYTTVATDADAKPGTRNDLKKIEFDFGYGKKDIRESSQVYI